MAAVRLAFLVLPLALVSFAGCAAPRTTADLTIVAQEYAFNGPDSVTGDRIALHLQNNGHETHHIAIARLDAGHTMQDFLTALADPNGTEGSIPWAHWVGGAGPFAPGGNGVAYLDLTPGTYVMVCFVPDAKGVPHFAHGMAKQVTVNAPKGPPPAEPSSDLTITQNDFSFTFDKPLTPGMHTIKVQNSGAQVHEAILVKLDAGKTGHDFVQAFGPNATGPPPGTFVGGFSEQDPGRHGFFTIDAQAGHYVLLCFVSDPQSHAPHFALGMMKEFDV